MSKKLFTDYKKIWWSTHNTMETLYHFIKDYKIDVDDYGNITVSNTHKHATVPVFCSHLDTVHEDKPFPSVVKDDLLMSLNNNGIGGDDKCGIVACLELLKKIPCKVIFFRDEETGCRGAKTYNQKTLKDNLFMVEIDRKGNSDLIFNGRLSGTMASKEFIKDVCKIGKEFGFKEETGLFTDVSCLDDTGISRMNVSCGYYLPHSSKEYVLLSELQNTIDLCYALGSRLNKQYKHVAEVLKVLDTEEGQLWLGGEYGYFPKENE